MYAIRSYYGLFFYSEDGCEARATEKAKAYSLYAEPRAAASNEADASL